MKKHANKFILAGLIVVFIIYGILIFQPIEFLLKHFVLDDAFYYFKTASNIAHGSGPTFDGEHLTNGYHPLWMGISAIVYYFVPGMIAPIRVLLLFSLLLFVGTTFLIKKIVAKFSSDILLQWLCVLLYAINPWNVNFYFGGLETPLALFFAAWMFLLLIGVLKNGNGMFLLGVSSGLLVLSRLDYAFFPFVIFIYFLARRRDFFWKKILLFVIPAGLIASPWFLYNYLYFGSPIPASGLSYTLINYQLFFYKDRSILTIVIWSLQALIGTIAFNLNVIGIPAYFSLKNIARSALSLGGIVLIVCGVLFYFYRAKREAFAVIIKNIIGSSEGIALLLFTFVHVLLIVVHGAIRWSGRSWYFATLPMIMVIALGIILDRLILKQYIRSAMIIIFIMFIVLFGYQTSYLKSQHKNQVEVYDAAIWVRDNVPADARIASFNSGIHGYFSGHFLMNSDGLINNAAYEAMRKNKLWEFFKNEHIDYILDYDTVLSYRYKSFFGIPEPLEHVKKIDLSEYIEKSGSYGGSHVNLYKMIYE